MTLRTVHPLLGEERDLSVSELALALNRAELDVTEVIVRRGRLLLLSRTGTVEVLAERT